MFGRMLRIKGGFGSLSLDNKTLIEPKCALGIEADTGQERNACRRMSVKPGRRQRYGRD
jgi:hypothetical protein